MDEFSKAVTIIETDANVVSYEPIEEAGQAANVIAARGLFANYRKRRAPNTKERQDDDLTLYAKYLAEAGIIAGDEETIAEKASALTKEAATWKGTTWGLVSGFVRWLEHKGYAVGSINVRLTTVKVYAGLAKQAGTITQEEYTAIMLVKGYRHSEGKNVDIERAVTRLGPKKAEASVLSKEQADALKNGQPNTPQGRRDAVMMCLLLDHGLRVQELSLLTRKSINLAKKELVFDRPKVDLEAQIHTLSDDTYRHLKDYLKHEKPTGQLLMGSRKGQEKLIGGMSIRAIKARVRSLGLVLRVPSLSPHDCRHYWATSAARGETSVFALQEAGGWKSLDMPRRYVARAKIANAGVKFA